MGKWNQNVRDKSDFTRRIANNFPKLRRLRDKLEKEKEWILIVNGEVWEGNGSSF
jgi:hypothetical protein